MKKKNTRLNNLFNDNNNYKKEKIVVNKEIKFRNTDEKNSTSETEGKNKGKKNEENNNIKEDNTQEKEKNKEKEECEDKNKKNVENKII